MVFYLTKNFFQLCFKGNCVDVKLVDLTIDLTQNLNCTQNTCQNNGICIPISEYYVCACAPGFTGE